VEDMMSIPTSLTQVNEEAELLMAA